MTNGVQEGLGVAEEVGEMLGVTEGVREGVGVVEGVGDCVGVTEGVVDGVREAVGDIVGVTEGMGVLNGELLELGEAEGRANRGWKVIL